MATFDDFKRVIKDTIQVDMKQRYTPQEVKFINRNNEFYGSFNGKFKINEAEIQNATLSNCTIYGDDGKPLNLSGVQILEGRVTSAESEIKNIYGKIDEMYEDISEMVSSCVRTQISNVIQDISDVMSVSFGALNQKIDDEISTRKQQYEELCGLIDSTKEEIEDKLCAEISVRIQNDNEISSKLSQKITDLSVESNDRMDQLSSAIDESIKNQFIDKHYKTTIASTTVYPYVLDDFRVNLIGNSESTVDVVDGYVVETERKDYKVAKLEGWSDSECSSKFIPLMNATEYSDKLILGNAYILSGSCSIPTINGWNLIQEDQGATGRSIKMEKPGYSKSALILNEKEVGSIDNPRTEADGTISAGQFRMFYDPGELSAFNAWISRTDFSKYDREFYDDQRKNMVRFDYEGQKFELWKNIAYIKKFDIKNGVEVVAKVFDGDIHIEDNDISAIIVTKNEDKISLTKENGFNTHIGNCHYLSCKIEETEDSKIGEFQEYEEWFKYQSIFRNSDDNTSVLLKISDKDVKVQDLTDQSISVIIADYAVSSLNGTYELSKGESDWYYNNVETGTEIRFVKETNTIYLNRTKPTLIVQKEFMFESEHEYEHLFDSKYIFPHVVCPLLSAFDGSEHEIDYTKTTKYSVGFGPIINLDTEYKYFDINRTKNEIDFIIKTNEHKDQNMLRELFVVVKPMSSGMFVKLNFTDENGQKIKTVNGENVILQSNKQSVLRLQEITDCVFSVEDINLNEEDWKFDWLKRMLFNLSSEFTVVSSDVYQLSSEFQQVSSDFYQTSAAFNIRIGKNEEDIKDIYTRLKGGLSFRGVMNLDDDKDKISTLFFDFYKDPTVPTVETLSTPLSSGWFYIIKTNEKSRHYIVEGLEVEDKDYIIVKNPSTVGTVTSNDVNVVDMMDTDVFRLSSDNHVNGHNLFEGSLSVDFKIVYDNATRSLSDLIDADIRDFGGIYSAIDQIITYAKLEEFYDFTFDIPLSSAFDYVNRIAQRIVKDDPKPYVDIVSGTVGDGVDALVQTINRSDIVINSTLFDQLKELNDRLNRLSLSVGNLNEALGKLSEKVDDNDRNIRSELKLSVETLSGCISEVQNNLNLSVETIENQISVIDDNVDVISSKVEFLLSTDRESMSYFGSIRFYDHTLPGHIIEPQLSDVLEFTFGKEKFFKQGFTYRISADYQYVWENSVSSVFGKNDYFVFKRDVFLTNAKMSDLDMFRDAQKEFEILSVEFDGKINRTIDSLSTTCEIPNGNIITSLTEISGIINCESRRIISSDIDELSEYVKNEIRLSVESLDVDSQDLSTTAKLITSLSQSDGKIEYGTKDLVSSDVKGLSDYVQNEINLSIESISSRWESDGEIVSKISQSDGIVSAEFTKVTDQFIGDETISQMKIKGLSTDLFNVSSEIKDLSAIDYKTLKFNGHITKTRDISDYDTISAVFNAGVICDEKNIYNGSFIQIDFQDGISAKTRIDDCLVGKGDYLIVHDHTKQNRILLASELVYKQNVFVMKAGVSQYDIESSQTDLCAYTKQQISYLKHDITDTLTPCINQLSSILNVELIENDFNKILSSVVIISQTLSSLNEKLKN